MTENEFYRRKKSSIAVRQVSGDRIVAMVEIVSPGNKSSRNAVRSFVGKACDLLEHRIHLLIVDLFPPSRRDPEGFHGLIWDEMSDEAFHLPNDKPLTLASYECELVTRAYSSLLRLVIRCLIWLSLWKQMGVSKFPLNKLIRLLLTFFHSAGGMYFSLQPHGST